mmetsp:Transcript_16144/g.26358  ORF Transcript_16144/g.26358 Transcript_16144/m.26358 type:complete len:138 (+) Transcript_16144:296-709(+)
MQFVWKKLKGLSFWQKHLEHQDRIFSHRENWSFKYFFDHVDELGLDQCRKELLPLECSPGKYKLIPVGAFDTLKREVKGFMKTVLFPQYLGHLQTKSSRRLLDTFVSGTWLIPPQPKHSECKSPNTSPKSATSVNYF